jgi:hypothetical protein
MRDKQDLRALDRLIETVRSIPWLLYRLGDEPQIETREDVLRLIRAFDTWPEWIREALGYRFAATWHKQYRRSLEEGSARYQTGTVVFRPSRDYKHGVEVVGNEYDLAVRRVREVLLRHGALPFGRSSGAGLPTDYFTVLFLEGETDVSTLRRLLPDLPDITPLPREAETRTPQSYLASNQMWYWELERLWELPPVAKEE